MRQLVSNKIRIWDDTILQSFSRHDYREYTDCNGVTFSVDGGVYYLRRSGDPTLYTELSCYADEPFRKVREEFNWGGYGPKGDQPLTYKPLKDLDSSHIEAILEVCFYIPPVFRGLFEKELKYRDRLV